MAKAHFENIESKAMEMQQSTWFQPIFKIGYRISRNALASGSRDSRESLPKSMSSKWLCGEAMTKSSSRSVKL
jgi:hypothetical protein